MEDKTTEGEAVEAIERMFACKDGQIVAQWLADQMSYNRPLTMIGDSPVDPYLSSYRDGIAEAYRRLLELAGYRITYERKPDERRDDDGTDGTYGSMDGLAP